MNSACSFTKAVIDAQSAELRKKGIGVRDAAVCTAVSEGIELAIGLVLTTLGVLVSVSTLGGAAPIVVPILALMWSVYAEWKKARGSSAFQLPCEQVACWLRTGSFTVTTAPEGERFPALQRQNGVSKLDTDTRPELQRQNAGKFDSKDGKDAPFAKPALTRQNAARDFEALSVCVSPTSGKEGPSNAGKGNAGKGR